jgi:hypothetical protein
VPAGVVTVAEVAAKVTPCTAQDVVNALCEIWPYELGDTAPTLATACVLAAQFAFETTNGSECVQYNIGNFKYRGSGNFCSFPTTEWIDGVETEIRPPDPGCRFMAYSSLENGVRAWLRDIYTHWTLAWKAACAGDPEGFAQGLKDQKPLPYYTGPANEYRAGMRRDFDLFMKSIVLATAATNPPDPLADTDPG